MLINYLTIAFRNLRKNKLYSFINIGGLAVGISVCMLIMLYVTHEMSFDRFHKNADRIFYMVMKTQFDGKELSIDRMSYQSGPMIKNADPGVQDFLRLEEIYDKRVIENLATPEKKFTEKNIMLADKNFFDFFSFKLIKGSAITGLERPFTMIISQRAAEKYFGDTDPVGKLLKYDNQHVFEITGIAANPPSNSSIDYDFIGSLSSLAAMRPNDPDVAAQNVDAGQFRTFLSLRKGADMKATEKRVAQLAGASNGKFSKFNYSLNAWENRHRDYDPSNAKYRKIFSWVAAIVLFLALINYMSLATARSSIRSKEVGVRKVLGASRGKIIKQFYVESGLYAVIAFILAVLLFTIFRPGFYSLLQLNIDDSFLTSPYTIAIFAGLLLITILISGSYPSMVLSSYAPVKVLYGKMSRQKAGAIFRKFFTVLQFTISVALIISSVIINKQLDFFRHMDTGIEREHIVMIPYQKNISQHYLGFKRSIEEIRGIEMVSVSAAPMYGGIDMTNAHYKSEKENVFMSEMFVDQKFFKMLGMRWKFPPADEQLPAKKGEVIINEQTMSKFNLPVNPIGEQIVLGRDSLRISGVVKNFNFASLRSKVEPLCMLVLNDNDPLWYSDNGDCLFAKISPNTNIPTLLESIRKVYEGFDKQTPFEYRFLDDAFDAQYRAEDRLSKIFGVFTIITIIIACLGLFGLAAFSAAQRTKEIGIRKVLGADVMNIITIISSNFIKPVFISILIAIPIAWLFMNKWLEDFAYRTSIGVWIFVLSAAAALLIAVLTVSFHSIKAAVANPVKSLRSE